MADTAGRRKAKAAREKASVLGNLPATRPERLGRPRAGPPAERATARTPRTGKRGAGKPAAVRPGVRALEPRERAADPPPARTVQPPRGTELVTTAIQAVGELAQIGFTVGGQALKRAVDRLPKP